MNVQVDDAVVSALESLVKLRVLSLRYTKITDKSIDSLSRMPFLTRLDLSMTHLQRPRLEQLRRLKALDLSFSRAEVLRLPCELEDLNLRRTRGELSAPTNCKSLKTLDVTNSDCDWEQLVAPDLAEIVVAHEDVERAARCFPRAKIVPDMMYSLDD
jgi:hypothetical protein